MHERERIRVSKRLSRHLRHAPGEIGLELGEGGWVGVADLLAALAGHGRPVSPGELAEVIERDDKRRFALDATGTRIRASQGHSVPVELGLPSAEPPAVLFHGTVAAALAAIRREGLSPMRRNHVHLSADLATAVRVGARRGAPVVLRVDAAAMTATGHRFQVSENGVWLTATVPPEFLAELPAPAAETGR